MHTRTRFQELTSRALEEDAQNHSDIHINDHNFARVKALSEVLGISSSRLIAELLDSALGDAHDGFLAAFDDEEARDKANKKLKARVAELLEQGSNK